MTVITRLDISGIRNIEQLAISPCKEINLIRGVNGSGKTSILEAIYLLATGRSFRSAKPTPVISHSGKSYTVFAELDKQLSVGLHRARQQKPLLKLQGARQANWLDVAKLFPVQLLDTGSFQLLEGGPGDRRRFLDWGVFHVEPAFIGHWRNSRKCIAQRNLMLKSAKPDHQQLQAWNTELVREAEAVDLARRSYFAEFSLFFATVLQEISAIRDISLVYKRGWDDNRSLLEVLASNESTDLKYGQTHNGPHRADVVVKVNGMPAAEVLSRGQQKILVSALKLAQGALHSSLQNRPCIFLIDDLPAELDEENRARICRFLGKSGSQVFMTCVDPLSLENCLDSSSLVAKFHVEHGKIMP